jgi:autotransporter-associated beta strand protein
VVISSTAGSLTLTTGDASNTTFAGVIQNGSGTVALTKQGAGIFTLSGTNTYSGSTTVSAGTLDAANASALGATAGGTTVSSGATLNINNVAIGAEAVTLNGNGVGGAGALTATGTASLSGAVTLASASRIGVTGGNSLSLSGTVEGPGALDILGGGTVTLGNTVGSSTALASISGDATTISPSTADWFAQPHRRTAARRRLVPPRRCKRLRAEASALPAQSRRLRELSLSIRVPETPALATPQTTSAS